MQARRMPVVAESNPGASRTISFAFGSSRFWRLTPVAEQLQQIVCSADQLPLAGGAFQASQSKAANAAYFLDLPKHRFDDRFSQTVTLFADLRGQSLAHAPSVI